MRDDRPFGFAGLWEKWEGEGRQAINSYIISTTEANEALQPVHDRMLVILHPDDYSLWLEGDERERALLGELLRPFSAQEMIGYPVCSLVNSPCNKGVESNEEVQLNSA